LGFIFGPLTLLSEPQYAPFVDQRLPVALVIHF